MSNKSVSASFFRIYGEQHDVEGCGTLFTKDAVVNHSASPVPLDFDGYKQLGYAYLAGFADLSCQIIDQVEEGDRVVSRVLWSGTHSGELIGIPATGRTFQGVGVTIDRFEGGKIKERWDVTNMLSMLQQLGVIPAQA